MDNIVNELINIENAADHIMAPVLEEQRALPDKIDAATKEIKCRIAAEAAETVKQIERSSAQAAQEAAARILAETRRKSSELEAIYEQNKDKWAGDIFNRIIGGVSNGL